MIDSLYTNTVDIYRIAITDTSGRKTETWGLNETGIIANIQPVSEEVIAMGEGNFHNTFTMNIGVNTDIQNGDKVIDNNARTFLVKGIQKWERSLLGLPHLEISMILI